jgi:hypothetical protein
MKSTTWPSASSALGPPQIPVAFRAGLVERLMALDAAGRAKPQ